MTGKRVIFLFLLSGSAAIAQVRDVDAPVTWEADDQVVDTNAKTVTTTGNVIVTQGDMRLRADTVRIEGYEGSTAERIVANTRVVVDSPTMGTATGDTAIYDIAQHLITFTGKVVLTKDKNVLRGSVLTYNLDTRQAKFSNPGRRVQGLFASPVRGNP